MKMLLTIGCSGSGKSTYAKDLIKSNDNWVEIRTQLFLKANEDRVSDIALEIFLNAVSNHKNVVVSDTNLSLKTREKWYSLSEKYSYIYEEKIFGLELTIDDLIKRDKQRIINPVGKEVLLSQWVKFYSQFGKKHKKKKSLPNAMVIDIDGTICTKNPIRNYYQWDLVGLDIPRVQIIHLIEFLSKQYYPIFMSGRDSICYNITKDWIINNVKIEDFSLHMREESDTRCDRIVKTELFFKYVDSNYNVVYAIDDRPKIIRLWKDIGIENVIDVSTSYIEF